MSISASTRGGDAPDAEIDDKEIWVSGPRGRARGPEARCCQGGVRICKDIAEGHGSSRGGSQVRGDRCRRRVQGTRPTKALYRTCLVGRSAKGSAFPMRPNFLELRYDEVRRTVISRSPRIEHGRWGQGPELEGSCRAGLGALQSHGIWRPLRVCTLRYTLFGPANM